MSGWASTSVLSQIWSIEPALCGMRSTAGSSMALSRAAAKRPACTRRYGISRQRTYQLLECALTDTKGKLREAEREAEFRRRVRELGG